jgi:hypothetical protein
MTLVVPRGILRFTSSIESLLRNLRLILLPEAVAWMRSLACARLVARFRASSQSIILFPVCDYARCNAVTRSAIVAVCDVD